jgi:hypothetical protein
MSGIDAGQHHRALAHRFHAADVLKELPIGTLCVAADTRLC